jgi:hypothetical protein
MMKTAMLTITVKHSFNMKSRAVLHTALLDRSKFLEWFTNSEPIPAIPSEVGPRLNGSAWKTYAGTE